MIDISIVIINYNVKDYIIPCINSIIDTRPKNLMVEIIVVDNNSKDGSITAIQDNFPNINLIINNRNEGFTKGVNLGVKSAQGKYLFILNPDTLLLEDSIIKLFDFMEKNENVGVLGPKIFTNSMKLQQSIWRKPNLYNTLLSILYLDRLNHKKNYKNNLEINSQVDCISGAGIFIKLSLFKSMKGLDNNLFWMEDIDFCVRCLNNGYNNYYINDAEIIHHKGKSSEKNWSITTNNQLISKIKYFQKHQTSIQTFILTITIFAVSILKLLLLIPLSPINTKYRNKKYGYYLVIKDIILKNY
jgi:N-acetylglucosaminyl-diphospho-decaprenol L-rhamnosyltransferase